MEKYKKKRKRTINKILILLGPNINMLGLRENEIYGNLNYNEFKRELFDLAKSLKIDLTIFQSNHEGDLITQIQDSKKFDYLLLNSAAYTHTSVAIRDALLIYKIPFIEIHFSNIASREEFRIKSLTADLAKGVIFGLGIFGFKSALIYAASNLKKE